MLYLTYAKRTSSRMQKEGRGELNLKMNLETFNLSTWYSSRKKFLLSPKNKKAFTEFVVKEWRRVKYRTKLTHKVLFVTCESDYYKITSQAVNLVDELNSIQEEADTSLILHASHAARLGYKVVVVAAEDTDVFLLCLAFNCLFPASMYVKCGTQTRTIYVSISSVVAAMGRELCKCLIGMHTFTGCDTVSAFARRGKITALRPFKQHTSYQEMFDQLSITGFYQKCFFRASKRLHASYIALNQEPITSMS